MKVIEITEASDPLAEYANSQEPIMKPGLLGLKFG
jgi:hypothetical protein